MKSNNIIFKVFRFYYDGFRSLPGWGKNLWLIILIKLFIMMVVLKIFLMPNFLKRNFDTNQERGKHVLEQLSN